MSPLSRSGNERNQTKFLAGNQIHTKYPYRHARAQTSLEPQRSEVFTHARSIARPPTDGRTDDDDGPRGGDGANEGGTRGAPSGGGVVERGEE